MKNLFTQCILLLAAINMVSCHNPNGRTTAKRTVIDGKVTNLQAFPDSKTFTLEVMDFGGNPTTYKGTIHKDGSFKIYFDQYIAQDVTLTPIVRTFIAHPGDSIHIDIDYNTMGDVVFSGDGEKTNTDINHYTGEYYSNYDKDKESLYFRAMDTASFRAVCENIKVEMLKNRADFIDKYNPNNEVKMWTKNYINIHYYGALIAFERSYNAIQSMKNSGSSSHLKIQTIPDNDLNQIYDNSMLNTESYRLLNVLMPDYNKLKYAHDYNAIIKAEIPLIEKSYKNVILKQMLAGKLFYTSLTKDDTEDFDSNKSSFNSGIQAAFIKQPLLKYYGAVKKNLANPEIASDAILKNATGPAKDLIDSIKNQNKGKVILVDFWATWCGPCKAEMPYTKQLIEKYKGKDVSFVFICVDSPNATWKANLAQMKLAGSQYFCNLEQSNSLRKGLNIQGIPYHILLNKKGDITESGNFLSMRDPLTQQKIEKLLN